MILGVGVDLVEMGRFQELMDRFGEKFLKRVFLSAERAWCRRSKDSCSHFAARFAAKEALAKAFGTGIGAQLGWKDIEIRRHKSGQPFLLLHGKAKKLARNRGVTNCHLSLTHTITSAAAVVILEGKE